MKLQDIYQSFVLVSALGAIASLAAIQAVENFEPTLATYEPQVVVAVADPSNLSLQSKPVLDASEVVTVRSTLPVLTAYHLR